MRYTAIDRTPASVLAAVRRGAREGVLLDAAAEPEFIGALMAKINASETVGNGAASLEFRPTSAFAAEALPEFKTVTPIGAEQSNSSIIVDNRFVVKVLRRITAGIHPEIEVGRFLADVAHFQNAPLLLGSVELVEGNEHSALVVVHRFVENQGDAWGVTANGLNRLVEEQWLTSAETIPDTPEAAAMLQRMRQIGLRTAEMHLAFACSPDTPGFEPEPINAADVAGWTESNLARTRTVFELLHQQRRELPEPTRVLAQRLIDHRDAIVLYIESGWNAQFDGLKIRHHGDFHLGQVLIAKDDIYILDFEGEPRRSLAERRGKAPPARDVAGLLRSIDYAVSAAVERAGDLNADERAVLTQRLRLWAERMEMAYCQSYRETLGDNKLWPADAAQSQALLNLFVLEKALYEIEYELTNRPSWAHIPLEATLRILQQWEVIPPEPAGTEVVYP
jgi:maltose alpha-D-glucosyltransferase/alpha-amylase